MVSKTQALVGSGIAGTGGGVGVVGWQVYEYYVPNQHRQLTRENYIWNPPKASDMGNHVTNVSQIDVKNLNFSSYKCFEHFFPGAEKVNEREKNRLVLQTKQ